MASLGNRRSTHATVAAAALAGFAMCEVQTAFGTAFVTSGPGSAQAPVSLRGWVAAKGGATASFEGQGLPYTGLAAMGVAVSAAAGLRRAGARGSLSPKDTKPKLALAAEPEVDPRRKDPPTSVPPVPMPTVETSSGEKLDVMSKLLQDRIIICGGEVKDEMAQVLIAQMLYLASESAEEDITMYINSPGGSVSAGMAIFDTMQFIPCDVSTVCFGMAASMGSFLLSAGTKGKRKSLPNSRIMIHQPLGGAQGQATDVRIQAREILYTRDILNQHLADMTGQTPAQIEKDCDRDNFMTPEEAKEYGLIDSIIETKSWPRIQKPPRPSV